MKSVFTKKHRKMPLPLLMLADIILAGLGLIIFALFLM